MLKSLQNIYFFILFFYLINDHMYLNNIWGGFNSIIKKVAILKSVALLSSKWHE